MLLTIKNNKKRYQKGNGKISKRYSNQNQIEEDKKIYEELVFLGESLRSSIKQLKKDQLKNDTKQQQEKLKKEKDLLIKALNFDKNLSLKQNFVNFLVDQRTKKMILLEKMNEITVKGEQLKENNQLIKRKIKESCNIYQSINDQKVSLGTYLMRLERMKMQSMKDEINNEKNVSQKSGDSRIEGMQEKGQSQISEQRNDEVREIDEKVDQERENIRKIVQTTNIKQINLKDKDKYNISPDLFKQSGNILEIQSFKTKQLKSKQILRSLEQQLNPLRLNEQIHDLQSKIERMRQNQLKELRKKKLQQKLRLRESKIIWKEDSIKLDQMKNHIKNFKSKRFGNKFF